MSNVKCQISKHPHQLLSNHSRRASLEDQFVTTGKWLAQVPKSGVLHVHHKAVCHPFRLPKGSPPGFADALEHRKPRVRSRSSSYLLSFPALPLPTVRGSLRQLSCRAPLRECLRSPSIRDG